MTLRDLYKVNVRWELETVINVTIFKEYLMEDSIIFSSKLQDLLNTYGESQVIYFIDDQVYFKEEEQ